mmetsp:Transcript_25595/g.29229  ORF Transcript_25595/g.29229 Transcript_25595/m.29229 type:complete len:656 (+) Transcript_25595:2-1969(+)
MLTSKSVSHNSTAISSAITRIINNIMNFLNTLLLLCVITVVVVESKLTYKGRKALSEDDSADGGFGGKNGGGYDADGGSFYGGKKSGYDADGAAYGGKKAGYDADGGATFGGKKAGYDADGATYGGKKSGYDADGSYGGKKAGYDSDGSYGGKKAGYDSDGSGKKGGDGRYGGKKGGYDCDSDSDSDDSSSDGGTYGSKKGGCLELRDGDCEICGASKYRRPQFLKLRYVSDGAESFYQSPSASTCEDKLYPRNTRVLVSGHGTYELEDGDEFLVEPSSGFSPVTKFCLRDGYCCTFHTSCSEPIVVGDQFGPFQILAGNDCEDEDPSLPPFTIPPLTTPSPTNPPTPEPTNPPTPEPTRPPTPGPTRPPTPDPTSPPTPEPRSPPTPGPTRPPTPEPTRLPTPDPTSPPTPEPTDPTCIVGNVRIDDGGNTVVDVEFNYPELEPVPSDWVGLYPCNDVNLDPPYKNEPTLWVYTCYSRVCRFDDPGTATGVGSLTFDDNTLPEYSMTANYKNIEQIRSEQPGCYRILLNRIDGASPPPYYGICEGNEIELTPININPTPAPVVNPTPEPVVNPTPAPTSLLTTPATCESIPPTGCSVCGEGKFVSEPDAIFAFPGQPSVLCGVLETAGLTSLIPLDQCAFLPGFADPLCSCQDC